MGLSVPAHRSRVPGAPVLFFEMFSRLCGTAYAIKKMEKNKRKKKKHVIS